MLTYNWFNTSSYTTFFVTSIGTPLLLQMSAYNLEGDETRNSEHQVGYDWTHALEGIHQLDSMFALDLLIVIANANLRGNRLLLSCRSRRLKCVKSIRSMKTISPTFDPYITLDSTTLFSILLTTNRVPLHNLSHWFKFLNNVTGELWSLDNDLAILKSSMNAPIQEVPYR